ncbi:unnamed protein product [Spirodela intermedia]|uniref:Leucine-rich repeat-containing N-terminal plant-type domain-containing protein n=1 Tax=Spirodela intermedia TaxID=51605 RepID=A0A7I8ITL2_SPIIN|nr:unnamed protein product [Spirodela intermedia]CAA6660895.1 unnamed protein product [Spirodela intermedia]
MTLPIPAPFLFLLFLLPMLSADSSADREALLSFKGAISDDPLGALDSWNESTPLCQWHGVTCGGGTAEQVTQLALNGTRLTGTYPPSFRARLPHQARPLLGRLAALQLVILRDNSLSGEIPSALSNCSELLRMDLRNNNLRGKIPPELGSFPKLQFLSLSSNNLTGPIPSSLGEIPAELGGMKNLKVLDVYVNRLSGRIPSSVWNLSSLIVLHVGYNQLSGLLPWDLGQTLPNLAALYLFGNQFEGAFRRSSPMPQVWSSSRPLKTGLKV